MQTIEIELNQHFSPQIWPEVEAAFEGDDGKRLSHIMQAILFAERGEYFEKLNGDFMESLVLERNQPIDKLFFALRAAASALVFTNIKDRDYLFNK